MRLTLFEDDFKTACVFWFSFYYNYNYYIATYYRYQQCPYSIIATQYDIDGLIWCKLILIISIWYVTIWYVLARDCNTPILLDPVYKEKGDPGRQGEMEDICIVVFIFIIITTLSLLLGWKYHNTLYININIDADISVMSAQKIDKKTTFVVGRPPVDWQVMKNHLRIMKK